MDYRYEVIRYRYRYEVIRYRQVQVEVIRYRYRYEVICNYMICGTPV